MTIQGNMKPDIPVYPGGVHLARLKAVSSFMAKPNQWHPEPYPKLRWEWQMKLPDKKDPVPYSTFTSLSLHPKSNLPGLLKAIGVVPDAEGNFEESECVGKICYVVVEETNGRDGKPMNTTDTYAPYVRGAAAPAMAAAPPAPVVAPAAPVAPAAVEVEDDPFGDEGAVPF